MPTGRKARSYGRVRRDEGPRWASAWQEKGMWSAMQARWGGVRGYEVQGLTGARFWPPGSR